MSASQGATQGGEIQGAFAQEWTNRRIAKSGRFSNF